MINNSTRIYTFLIRTIRRPRWLRWQFLQIFTVGLCFLLCIWLVLNTITLINASSKPVSATFVLGGSIQREVYAAELASKNAKIPTLISQGSQEPCILSIFQRKQVILDNIWLEKCANSTFENFFYSLPILERWEVRKLRLITSQSHLPRAKWMAQIILGAHGIWVELDVVQEQGVPGNKESFFKTALDIIRSFAWAGLSHFTHPQCANVIKLTDVNLDAWRQIGYKCERETKIN
ncbi:MAG: YdcF family protein [Calothrix sp. C42_A2020_038]|nr:YdcF family protein [Calothrix sp. C42_A2020_038]